MVLRECEKEADVIVWDGGNNEVSFFVPDVLCVVADPLRLGHETASFPGEVCVATGMGIYIYIYIYIEVCVARGMDIQCIYIYIYI